MHLALLNGPSVRVFLHRLQLLLADEMAYTWRQEIYITHLQIIIKPSNSFCARVAHVCFCLQPLVL